MTKADSYMHADILNILNNGYWDVNPRPHYKDGTPAHTLSVNHVMRKYDLSRGEFPICTLRPMAWKTGIREIFTIYQKPTNKIAEMEAMGVNWWGEWDIGDGTIGQRYGATVKRYDLITNIINDIRTNPYGRRKIVSLWQETDLHETPGLAPCAFLTIWNVRNTGYNPHKAKEDGAGEKPREYLDMCLIQRSGDMLTASGAGGINEIQYAALLMMIARHCGYEPGIFTHFVANEQIYDRHMDAAQEMLCRFHKSCCRKYSQMLQCKDGAIPQQELKAVKQVPNLVLNAAKRNFYEMTVDDFVLENYDPTYPQLTLELGI